MSRGRDSALWPARLRWRLRGGPIQWPLFAVLTVVDALLLHFLPIAGRHTGILGALLLAFFFNLLAVAALGRFIGWWLHQRQPDIPRVVAEDRAGSAMLAVVTLALLAGGLAHSPARHAADRAFALQRAAARAYVLAHGATIYRANLRSMTTREESPGFYRSCVPGDPTAGLPPLCLLIRTDRDPPTVVIDHDRTP